MTTTLPDAICSPLANGNVALVMGKKARRFISKGLSGKFHWRKTRPTRDTAVSSMNYRALVLEPGPAIPAMLCAMYEAGLLVHVHCDDCGEYHAVEPGLAKHMKMDAVAGAEGVLPPHSTLQ